MPPAGVAAPGEVVVDELFVAPDLPLAAGLAGSAGALVLGRIEPEFPVLDAGRNIGEFVVGADDDAALVALLVMF